MTQTSTSRAHKNKEKLAIGRAKAMGIQSLASPQVPRINFSVENLEPHSTKWLETCSQVREALEEYGCFLAECESFPQELDDAIFKGWEELFDLPLETKMKNVSDKPYHGFLDHRTPFILPLYESLGIENATSFEAVESFVKLMWPSGNDRFCENVIQYSKMISEMEQIVKRMVFESYGVGELQYDSHIASSTYLLRAMKYRIPAMDEENIGAHPHTDKSFFTILHQNNGVHGLEIKSKNAHQWLPLQFSPNSFLLMAGDACLAWSNGRIHSASHRVIVDGSKERYSTGLFSYHKGIIEIPHEFVDDQHPLRFNSFNHYGLLGYFSTDDCEKVPSTAKAYCGL